ncbi:Na+ dependent nucleoside transporter C-terminus-domain-containing protein [Thelephora terrestris]|uniref:Na+ dependent nucleoside transporter C-terminus-domain-containing protein n=1 Tax=Thelephora terrestris TaxID=56493 RepID=A0A9P6HXI3_9AGAM|nr:Na+ dependent nucleoside transporter C-terminus-domain-containing protein [Thelephora terrestris]
MSAVQVNNERQSIVERKQTASDSSSVLGNRTSAAEVEKGAPQEDVEEYREHSSTSYERFRPFILLGLALLIFGWWVSSIVLPATRHRWIVQTFWAWTFILIIAFRFIPNSVVSKPVAAVWGPLVARPFGRLPRGAKLGLGWLALLSIVFGSAFGFPLPQGTTYGDRAISVLGLFVFQFSFWLTSHKRSQIPWQTVIVGLFFQQAIALFVLKTDAGFQIFKWIAFLASDFLEESHVGAIFFFDEDTVVNKQWFFVTVLSAIVFFIAFVQMLYYLGVMQWIIRNFAWFFFKTMNVSGAEAVIAAASPFIGQGESACLVRPYVEVMTDSEIHLAMTSGFSTIAGSVLLAYISLGVPAQNLITSSVMSIPASMATSKLRYPETEEPVTRGRVIIDRGEPGPDAPANTLHAFSQGAIFGLVVAGLVLANVLTILSLVAAINGLLTWIGKGFGIHALTLQLILGYIFYPLTFFLGVPRGEIIRVSRLLATKLVANEFSAYLSLQAIMSSDDPLSYRAWIITQYALCGFANLGSLGIQVGVLSAMAPSKAKIISRIALSAMICGFVTTMQTAGIAGMLI